MGRRRTVDEETAAIATERLARLLADLAPRRAAPDAPRDMSPDAAAGRALGVATDADAVEADDGGDMGGRDSDGGDSDAGDADARRPARARTTARVREAPASPARSAALSVAGAARGFGRRHLGVLALILVIGLAAAGWALLRARPVAVATPLTVATTEVAPSATVAATPTAGAVPSARASPASSPSATILVHVLGAVRHPGVASLPERARVQDALDAAGGLAAGARPGELNLAQVLTDGQQVVIGTARDPGGQVRNGSAVDSGGAGSAETGTASAGSSGGAGSSPVDLNSATLAQLDALPGVGPVTAERILAWRTEHGRFSRVEELQEIDGIGPKTYARLAPHVRV